MMIRTEDAPYLYCPAPSEHEQWYDVLSGNRAFLRSLPSGVKVWGKKMAKLQRVDRHVIEHSGI